MSHEYLIIKYITKERTALEQILNLIETDPVVVERLNKIIENIISVSKNNGRIIFSGVGKNVYGCQKIAATFCSLNILSFYFDAVHALHGDIGMIKNSDLLICLSKSGNTEELIKTLIYINNNKELFKFKVWGIDCSRKSEFDKYCDNVIHLPFTGEIDKFNIVPTSSAIILQIIGDIIGLCVMDINSFNLSDFNKNHPGGQIGQILNKKFKK